MPEENNDYILVIEDDPGVCELEAQRLQPLGLKIRKARNAAEGYAAMKSGAPALILVDYSLPDSNALVFIGSLRATSRELPPFIVVTGHGDEAVAVSAMKSGASDYIVKAGDFLEKIAPTAAKVLKESRLQAELHASNERFRYIFELANLPKSLTAPDGTLSPNKALCQLLGYTREELSSMSWRDITSPEDIPATEKILGQLASGEQDHARFEKRYRRKDGSLVWCEVNVTEKRDGAGRLEYYITAITDMTERRALEDTARQAEQRYRELLESLPDIVMNFDRELRHTYVSPNVEPMTGLLPADFLGKTHAEMGFPAELCAALDSALKEAFASGQPGRIEFSSDLPAGNRTFDWRLSPVKNGNGEVASVTTMARDITQYHELESDYRQLFNTMLDGFALHEMVYGQAGRPVDYRFLSMNPAFERLTGLKADRTLNRLASEVLGGEEKEWVEIYGKVVDTGEAVRFEKFSDTLGKYYDILAFRPRPGKFACIFRDITEQKKAEAKMKDFVAVQKLAGQVARFGAWSVDLSTNICYWSDEVAAIHEKPAGYCPKVEDEMNFYAPEYRERIASAFGACARDGVPYDEELEIITAAGNRRWVRVIGQAERGVSGAIAKVSGSFQDITERKQMESEIMRAQKIESLGLLAGGIAHDFNNMLVGITANLSLLAAKNPAGADILEDALAAARGAQSLTTQLLSFSKGGQPVKKELCLRKALKDIFTLATSGASAAKEAEIPEGLWGVEGDENQLKQVINNLLLNGVQAMPSGGTIRLKAENAGESYPLPPSLKPGKYVKITVSDSGIGIQPQHLSHIFEPYFTTKTKGHGLGLAMAWRVARDHGGCIEAESQPGKGTEFRLFLPATGHPMKEAVITERGIVKGSGRILLLEDEEIVSRAAVRMLTELGYTCEVTKDGRETLKLYAAEKAAGRPFAAVIADITIPGGMGGKAAGKELRRLYPGAILIVSSGYSDEAVMSEYKHYGFDAVLPKPYRYEDLAETLSRLLKKK